MKNSQTGNTAVLCSLWQLLISAQAQLYDVLQDLVTAEKKLTQTTVKAAVDGILSRVVLDNEKVC